MSWTTDQCANILDGMWRATDVRCPTDNTPLRTSIHKSLSGSYAALANCPRCGTRAQMGRGDDALASTFRPWTDEEKASLADSVLDQRHPRCPVDDTPLVTQESRSAGGKTHVLVSCFRCLQRHSEAFPRAA